ncbi:MAG: helix-turn-helix transcriptional regulator [Chlamydiia bacterium]|nr:helix-turn-helix transcriptional regulator [Chlamydiia bacterium]
MSVRTRTHLIKKEKIYTNSTQRRKKRRIPWREVAKKEISRFSEPGVILKGCRYKKNITQEQLSETIGVQQNHISEMETGKRSIGKEMAKKLAKFFKTNYRVFL